MVSSVWTIDVERDKEKSHVHILIPILTDTIFKLVLESDLLEPNTHYSATLLFYPQTIISTRFCKCFLPGGILLSVCMIHQNEQYSFTATYIVQDIIITILPYELSVECVFAMGSIQYTSCTVILVLDDIEIRRQDNFTGEWRFDNLSIGSYTVLVYDSSQYDIIESSGDHQEPAVQRVVEVIGKPTYYSEKSGNIMF